ncbi:hypothetical protein L1887_36370 [Cichorium endivia]|nr:hypothetical protein L1887_36370 [Cichorium endivia]
MLLLGRIEVEPICINGLMAHITSLLVVVVFLMIMTSSSSTPTISRRVVGFKGITQDCSFSGKRKTNFPPPAAANRFFSGQTSSCTAVAPLIPWWSSTAKTQEVSMRILRPP